MCALGGRKPVLAQRIAEKFIELPTWVDRRPGALMFGYVVLTTYVAVMIAWYTVNIGTIVALGFWNIALLVITVILGLLMLARASHFNRKFVRHMLYKVVELADVAGQEYTLYLRPFTKDGHLGLQQRVPFPFSVLRDQVSPNLTEEVQLIDALAIGAAVAVGAPEEELPPIGASRVYLGEDWQEQIRSLMPNAQRTVILAGVSDGVLWELSEACARLEPDQLVLVVAMSGPEYEKFRTAARRYLRKNLHSRARDSMRLPAFEESGQRPRSQVTGVILFDARWNGVFSPLRAARPFYNPLAEMVRRAVSEGREAVANGGPRRPGSAGEQPPTLVPRAAMAAAAAFAVPFFVMPPVVVLNSMDRSALSEEIRLVFGTGVALYACAAAALWTSPHLGRRFSLGVLLAHVAALALYGDSIERLRIPYDIVTIYAPAAALVVLYSSEWTRAYLGGATSSRSCLGGTHGGRTSGQSSAAGPTSTSAKPSSGSRS
jgi:hypothetical protein